MTRKRIALISLAAGLVLGIGLLVLALNWTTIRVKTDPLGALKTGAERVKALPDPLNLGFLGTVEAGDTAYNCSGSVQLETSPEGLRVYLADCTVGDETASQTFSLYADPTCAAARTGSGWQGVELTRPLADQAQGTAYESLYTEDQRAQAQADADGLREALGAVTALDFAAEKQAVWDFLDQAQGSGQRMPGGWYLLKFFEDDYQRAQALSQALSLPEDYLVGLVMVDFDLTREGVFQSVSLDSWNLDFSLELGEDEQTARLEASWLDDDGQSWSATLALTIEPGESVAPPAFENALALLG